MKWLKDLFKPKPAKAQAGGEWIVRCFYGFTWGGLDFNGWPDGDKIKSKEDAEALAKYHIDYQLKNYGVCNSRYQAYYRRFDEPSWGPSGAR